MSKLEVDKITPQSGTTLTIGDSGDTIVIDSTSVSGAKLAAPTLVGSSSSAGSILFKEDTDNGTNSVTLKGPAATADVTLTLPAATDTVVGRQTTDTLTNKTINASQLVDASIATGKLADDAVTYAKMQDTSTANRVLGAASAGTISEVQIATDMIVDANVTTAKINDNAVTLAKMASGTDGNIISYDTSGNPVAVATGNDGQVLTSAGAGAVPTFETLPSGGITEADMHRLTTNFNGNVAPISSNWERCDENTFAKIGTGITNNSGTWSFGATGLYEVTFQLAASRDDGARYVRADIYATSNNSSYVLRSVGWSNIADHSGTIYSHANTSIFLNVDNTTNIKFKLGVASDTSNATTIGNTDENVTFVTAIRLGDAQ